jgi:hypothetical protein
MLSILAAEAAEHSKTLFYFLGGLAAVWAVIVSVIGLRQPEFPGGVRGERVVIGISVVVVAAALISAVIINTHG